MKDDSSASSAGVPARSVSSSEAPGDGSGVNQTPMRSRLSAGQSINVTAGIPSPENPGACTLPRCDAVEGCLTEFRADGVPCDDGLADTYDDACWSGVCQGISGASTSMVSRLTCAAA